VTRGVDRWDWDKIRENCRQDPKCMVVGEDSDDAVQACIEDPQCLYMTNDNSNPPGFERTDDRDELCRRIPNCLLVSEVGEDEIKRCSRDERCVGVLDAPGSKSGIGPGHVTFTLDWSGWMVDPTSARQFFLWAAPTGRAPATTGMQPLAEGFRAAGLALLFVFATFGVTHYLAIGIVSSGGGLEVVTAPLRVAGAGFFILAWPNLHSKIAVLEREFVGWMAGPNREGFRGALFTLTALFDSADSFKPLFPGPDVPKLPGASDLVSFILGIGVTLVLLTLTACKLMLTFGLVLLILAMPLLVAMWVLPGMAWLTNSALKAAVAISLVPVGWAASLRAYSEIAEPFERWAQPGTFVPELARAMAGVMLLLFLFTVMRQILRWAGVVSSGSRPLSTAWGAVTGLTFMAASTAYGAAATASRARSGRQRWAQQEARWAQQEARTEAGDIRREMQDAARLSEGANRQAEGIVRQTEGAAKGAEKTLARLTSEAQKEERYAKVDARNKAIDEARADAEARRELQWSPAPGANTDDTGLHTRYRHTEEAERNASNYRLRTDGPPELDTVERAWNTLAPEQRQGLQESVWGVPFGADPMPADRALERAASANDITQETRGAYRTLLDASRHEGSREAFELVTVQPPDMAPTGSSVGQSPNGGGSGGGGGGGKRGGAVP
jgi:hypothetical protein